MNSLKQLLSWHMPEDNIPVTITVEATYPVSSVMGTFRDGVEGEAFPFSGQKDIAGLAQKLQTFIDTVEVDVTIMHIEKEPARFRTTPLAKYVYTLSGTDTNLVELREELNELFYDSSMMDELLPTLEYAELSDYGK